MTETIWLKAYRLLEPEGAWVRYVAEGDPEEFDRECYCAGGAIAKVLTGSATNMYELDIHPEVADALTKFADHVHAPSTRYSSVHGVVEPSPDHRVFRWNDHYAREKADVLKALMELHEAEVAPGEPEDPEVFAYRHGYAP